MREGENNWSHFSIHHTPYETSSKVVITIAPKAFISKVNGAEKLSWSIPCIHKVGTYSPMVPLEWASTKSQELFQFQGFTEDSKPWGIILLEYFLRTYDVLMIGGQIHNIVRKPCRLSLFSRTLLTFSLREILSFH